MSAAGCSPGITQHARQGSYGMGGTLTWRMSRRDAIARYCKVVVNDGALSSIWNGVFVLVLVAKHPPPGGTPADKACVELVCLACHRLRRPVAQQRPMSRVEANLDGVIVRINLDLEVSLVEPEPNRHDPGRVILIGHMHNLGQIAQRGWCRRRGICHSEIMASSQNDSAAFADLTAPRPARHGSRPDRSFSGQLGSAGRAPLRAQAAHVSASMGACATSIRIPAPNLSGP